MPLSHLKSVCTLCPAGWQNFLFPKGAKRTENRSPEREVVRVIVLQVVRAVVRTVVRAIRRVTVVVVEHPRGGQAPNKRPTGYGNATFFIPVLRAGIPLYGLCVPLAHIGNLTHYRPRLPRVT